MAALKPDRHFNSPPPLLKTNKKTFGMSLALTPPYYHANKQKTINKQEHNSEGSSILIFDNLVKRDLIGRGNFKVCKHFPAGV